MEMKFFDNLYNGDSAKGLKLCLGLSDGDFWTRTKGVQLLYKGSNIDDVDFVRFEDAADINQEFVVSAGQALTRFLYIVRRANCCGVEEKTINAALRVEFDSSGNLIEQGCNRIINVSARQIDGDKVLLRWFYQPIHQAKKISGFVVYSDNGTGTIDFQNPIAAVEYTGRKFYQFVSENLTTKDYKFCIRAIAKDGTASQFKDEIKIQAAGI